MRKWLYDRPWIWVVLFLATLIGASIATVIIAEVNKPEIVKPKEPKRQRGTSSRVESPVGAWRPAGTVGGTDGPIREA